MPLSLGWHQTAKAVPLKVSCHEPDINNILIDRFNRIFNDIAIDREIVCICVGTDRSTGDALGPLVGSRLFKSGFPHLHLYGTLDDPVHAMNLHETLDTVKKSHTNPFIIAIDACLGQLSNVGYIQVGQGPVKPGAGVNKDLPPVGDIHITGIVNVGGFMEYFVLQNTRLSLVVRMADTISQSLTASLYNARVLKQLS